MCIKFNSYTTVGFTIPVLQMQMKFNILVLLVINNMFIGNNCRICGFANHKIIKKPVPVPDAVSRRTVLNIICSEIDSGFIYKSSLFFSHT